MSKFQKYVMEEEIVLDSLRNFVLNESVRFGVRATAKLETKGKDDDEL